MSKMVERMQIIVGKQDFESSTVNTLEPTNATRDCQRAWSDMTRFKIDPERMEKHRIISFSHSHSACASIDMVRTNIWYAFQRHKWNTIAVCSPTPNCGKSMLCANLAFSFSRLSECRTVLIDLDLRRPQIGHILGLKELDPIEKFLKEESPMERCFARCEPSSAEGNLAVAAASGEINTCAELLQSKSAKRTIGRLKRELQPHVVLVDLPPMLSSDDALSFLPNVDCVLLVVAAEETNIPQIDVCERELAGKTNFLGVVLNKCRYSMEAHGYY
jgi:protein-tyrosine kinase